MGCIIFWIVVASFSLVAPTSRAAPSEGDLRLIKKNGRDAAHSGNVYIFHAGKWGAVCDDGWRTEHAHVVCRALGFKRALGHTKYSYFGLDPPRDGETVAYWLDNLKCRGNEKTLLECEHSGLGQHDCAKTEMAGVYCAHTRRRGVTTARRTGITTPVQATRAPAVTATAPATRAPAVTTTTARTTQVPFVRARQSAADRDNEPFPDFRMIRINGNDVLVHADHAPSGISNRRRNTVQRPGGRGGQGQPAAQQRPSERRLDPGRPMGRSRQPLEIRAPPSGEISEGQDNGIDTSAENQVGESSLTSTRKQPDDVIKKLKVEIVGGMKKNEGRVEIVLPSGTRGLICGDSWGLMEAMVACRSAGLNYAKSAPKKSVSSLRKLPRLFPGITCQGHEQHLDECDHAEGARAQCSRKHLVAGVVCTDKLPDLMPNATLVEHSAYLVDQQMYFLQCAMEENCLSTSAYELRAQSSSWARYTRRLLRFSSSTWNVGTADFHPFLDRSSWEWHQCHRHYHSMEVFAHYDIKNRRGKRVAQGHKASFCLEDVQCQSGARKKYSCRGYGSQGISVGCADDYLHNIDCQWIDVTDLRPGTYVLEIHINPEKLVAEIKYDNNAVTCDFDFGQMSGTVRNCRLGGL